MATSCMRENLSEVAENVNHNIDSCKIMRKVSESLSKTHLLLRQNCCMMTRSGHLIVKNYIRIIERLVNNVVEGVSPTTMSRLKYRNK
jgi:hypothetical protein